MSLCRFLPTPSDRMGIIWSLLSVNDAILLEYGPAGTTHYSMGLYGALGLDWQQRLFTTHMSEDDVVMGDVAKLEEALLELDSSYEPKIIFVVASSISTVIGTDLKGVCKYMQADIKAKLIALERGGFQGDYAIGIAETYKLLVEELAKPTDVVIPNTCNILGVSMGNYRMTSDLWEIKNLLCEGFGMEVHTEFCGSTSVGAIETMGTAEINLILREEALPAAELLQERCGTTYVLGAPYGYDGTIQWLRTIEEKLGRPCNSKLIARLTAKSRMYMPMGGMMRRARRKHQPQAVIEADYEVVQGVSEFLSSMGFTNIHKICKHSLRLLQEPASDVLYFKEEGEKLKLLHNVSHALVMGNSITHYAVGENNTKVNLSLPLVQNANIASHLPMMGEKGADYIMEQIEIYMSTL